MRRQWLGVWGEAASARKWRSAAVLLADTLLVLVALRLAYLLHFSGSMPAEHWLAFLVAAPALAAIRLVSTCVSGLHRWAFLTAGAWEALRLSKVRLVGTFCLVALIAVAGWPNVPWSVIVLEYFFTVALTGALRFGPRLAVSWYSDLQRARGQGAQRALVVGAGATGDLLLRSLNHSPSSPYHVVGLVDDNPSKLDTFVGGKRVMGTLDDLPRLIRKHRAAKVLVALPNLAPKRLRSMLWMCAELRVGFRTMSAPVDVLDRPFSAEMLRELGPEQLLPREAVTFDRREFQGLVEGKTFMVTGGGGTIGAEIARQIAMCRPARLVLVDVNENELYLLARSFEDRHRDVKVVAAVADVREAGRISRLGARYRPDFVFHAAAHKHVPLMEDAPEEAVKNNVFGTLNVARMAEQCGAKRFVLISTDKAAYPASIMGATKRVAELVAGSALSGSRTAFTAVRFGNVLGSAGSVAQIFQQQIARGGPVTVTHPGCTRYFMTLGEAVGLLLAAGLGGYGELCVLDMGEPVRIAELAEAMIVMAGYVPKKEILIVFTGLRPGEKLEERLLTEEEEKTRVVRGRILVVSQSTPPPDLHELLSRLGRAAERGDPEEVKSALKAIVPSYTPAPTAPPAEEPVKEREKQKQSGAKARCGIE